MRDQPSCQCLQTQKKGNSPFVPAAHAELRSAPRRKHLRLAASASARKTERPGAKMSDFFFFLQGNHTCFDVQMNEQGDKEKMGEEPSQSAKDTVVFGQTENTFLTWTRRQGHTWSHDSENVIFFVFFCALNPLWVDVEWRPTNAFGHNKKTVVLQLFYINAP